MTANAKGWASYGVAGLAAIMVVAGLTLAGGPVQARKERRDADRVNAINDVSSQIDCLVRDNPPGLPASFGPTDGCPSTPDLNDPHTGTPMRVEAVELGKYRICADFELPPDTEKGTRYSWRDSRRDGSCMVFDLPPPRNAATAGQPG